MLLLVTAPGVPATANTASERSYIFYESAISLFNKQDYRGAYIQLKNALQQDARNAAARILLGKTFLQLDQPKLAEAELLRARHIGAHPDHIAEPLARAYFKQRKFDRLFNEIKPGHRGNRLEAKIYGIHGEAFFALHDWENAETAFSAATNLQPRAAFPLLGLARIKGLKRQFDEALSLVNRAIEFEPENPDAWYQKAEILRFKHDFTGALTSYGAAIHFEPDHKMARLGRATVLVDRRQDKAALEDIRTVRHANPKNARAAYLESVVLTRAGRVNEAQALLTEAENNLKKLSPDFIRNDPASLLLLGVIGFKRENFEDAYTYLNRYIEINPKHPGARKMLGWILLHKGEPWPAIKMLKSAVEQTPQDVELLTLFGKAYMQVKQYELATEILEKASALAPEKARIRTQLGLSRIAAGQSETGVGDLEQALRMERDGSNPGTVLGYYHLKRGEYENALRTAKSISEKEPQKPFAYNLAGAALLGMGKLTEARKQFETAIQIDPNYVPPYFNLAKIDIAEEDLDSAENRYNDVLQRRPKHVKALRALSDLAALKKDFSEAIRLLKEIAILAPYATTHQVRRVQIYMQQKRYEEAVNLARDLEIVNPTNPAILTILGHALISIGKFQEAAGKFQRLADVTRNEPGALLRSALLQEKARDYPGARATLQKAIALNDKALALQIALIRLEERNSNLDKAIALAGKLRNEHPESRAGDIVTGDLFMRAKRYEEATDAYMSAYDKEINLDVIQRLYDAKYRTGQTSTAFDLVAQWVANNPNDVQAKKLLASAHRRAGRVRRAIEINEELLTKIPDDPALLNNLAGLYQIAGDERARAFAEKAYKLAPENPAVLDTFGWILVTSGEAERGLSLLRQAYTATADNPVVQYHLAVALNLTGREKEAQAELAKALEMGERFEGIEDARLLLQKLNKNDGG